MRGIDKCQVSLTCPLFRNSSITSLWPHPTLRSCNVSNGRGNDECLTPLYPCRSRSERGFSIKKGGKGRARRGSNIIMTGQDSIAHYLGELSAKRRELRSFWYFVHVKIFHPPT